MKKIEQEKWEDFLNDFSAQWQKKEVDLRIRDDGSKKNIYLRKPLLSIEYETKGSFKGITVFTGELSGHSPEDYTHRIEEPKELFYEVNENGKLKEIHITSSKQIDTIIGF